MVNVSKLPIVFDIRFFYISRYNVTIKFSIRFILQSGISGRQAPYGSVPKHEYNRNVQQKSPTNHSDEINESLEVLLLATRCLQTNLRIMELKRHVCTYIYICIFLLAT